MTLTNTYTTLLSPCSFCPRPQHPVCQSDRVADCLPATPQHLNLHPVTNFLIVQLLQQVTSTVDGLAINRFDDVTCITDTRTARLSPNACMWPYSKDDRTSTRNAAFLHNQAVNDWQSRASCVWIHLLMALLWSLLGRCTRRIHILLSHISCSNHWHVFNACSSAYLGQDLPWHSCLLVSTQPWLPGIRASPAAE